MLPRKSRNCAADEYQQPKSPNPLKSPNTTTDSTIMTLNPDTVISYHKPANGESTQYRPATEGYFILRFKPGVRKEDLNLPAPHPARSFLQLAMGWVGAPRQSMEEAQRDLCETHVRYPAVAHHVEICKCPCALAAFDSFVRLLDTPDPRIMELARTVDWSWWMDAENYRKGTGKFALSA
jgi:hypothetical protein